MLKKFLCAFLAVIMCVLATGCTSGESNNNSNRELVVLPDYESMESEELIIMGWVAPSPTVENYQILKDAGFNYIFAFGQYAGDVGSEKIDEALDICDDLGIKVFLDVSRKLYAIDAYTEKYVQHSSFVGYNYDEPVIYKNTLNKADGLVDIAPVVESMHEDYPNVEFLVNLNPTDSLGLNWGTASFTYDEYLEAQTSYINSIYKDSSAHNWLSCDSYPICVNNSLKHPYYLKTTWLQNLTYLSEVKRDSDMKLTTNFFIQSMPYVGANNNRIPIYEDIRMQVYTLLACGYDAISYYCYATPTSDKDGEFPDGQKAMIDTDGTRLDLYYHGQKVNTEVRKFEKVYKQFNSNWIGVCPVYGTNNTSKDEFYTNKTMDLVNALDIKHLNGLESVETDEDIIIGYMKDGSGNSGFMVVNYNDTSYEKKVNAKMNFGEFTQAHVYQNGELKVVDLTNGELTLNLDVGEGVFVIPCS